VYFDIGKQKVVGSLNVRKMMRKLLEMLLMLKTKEIPTKSCFNGGNF
jgi:hypothetical protein